MGHGWWNIFLISRLGQTRATSPPPASLPGARTSWTLSTSAPTCPQITPTSDIYHALLLYSLIYTVYCLHNRLVIFYPAFWGPRRRVHPRIFPLFMQYCERIRPKLAMKTMKKCFYLITDHVKIPSHYIYLTLYFSPFLSQSVCLTLSNSVWLWYSLPA